ncbi:MAG: NAD(P)-binding domain-containing protein, partial [Pseudomonadota bacterium]
MTATRLAVLGAGSWGTALALQAVRSGHHVTLWGRSPQQLVALRDRRENSRYLPGVTLPDSLVFESDLARALRDCDGALIATPSHAFGATLDAVAAVAAPPLLWATKGFEPGSGRLLHEQ